MSRWDAFDRKAAGSIGRVFNSPVVWRPQRPRAGRAGTYTNGAYEPDPDRPVRRLQAAVTWRPVVVEAGANPNLGGVEAYACVVDFDVRLFSDGANPPNFSYPVTPDLFELTEEYEGNNLVQVRRSGDDGSQRMLFYCNSPDG